VTLAYAALVAGCAGEPDVVLPIDGRDDLSLRVFDVRVENGLSNEIVLEAPRGIESVLFEVRGERGLYYLTKFETPSGELIEAAQYTTRFARETPGLVDWLYPNTPTLALEPGTYRIMLRGEDPNHGRLDEAVEIRLYGKKQTAVAGCGLHLDILVDETAVDAKLEAAIDEAVAWLNDLYSQHGIRVLDYQITKIALPKPDFDPSSTSVIAQVDEVLAQARRKGIARTNGLHLVVVRSIGGDDPSGYSMGLPGPFDADRPNAAVLVATTPYTSPDGRLDGAGLGSTMAHEIGHYAGLYHTSEANGALHDPLPDTPMTGAADFSRNIMTPGGGAYRNSLTEDQAFVIKHHPLCVPIEIMAPDRACELSCTAPLTCSVAGGVHACRRACDPADESSCASGSTCRPDDRGTYACF
jgi:hypothetical protein